MQRIVLPSPAFSHSSPSHIIQPALRRLSLLRIPFTAKGDSLVRPRRSHFSEGAQEHTPSVVADEIHRAHDQSLAGT